jgi:hypothetical protein
MSHPICRNGRERRAAPNAARAAQVPQQERKAAPPQQEQEALVERVMAVALKTLDLEQRCG